MKFLKKYYKLIGTLITVVAFVFVIKKIVTMDVDWSMFASGKPLGIIAGCVLVQTAIIFFMSTPWVQFVRILSGKKIAMKDALPVYTKCNLMKYVPGNVFQYVGRNQLAADLHISTWTLPVPPFWKFCVHWWLRWCGSCCSWEKTWWD